MERTPMGARDFTMYDYTNQAFVRNQRFIRCGHPQRDSRVYTFDCGCYGRLHEDEYVATHATDNCPGCMEHGVHVAADCHSRNDTCIAEREAARS